MRSSCNEGPLGFCASRPPLTYSKGADGGGSVCGGLGSCATPAAGGRFLALAFITFFNADVRALDVRDPYHPKEVGYFIPPITATTDKRCVKINGQERCKTAIQSNNVETDERGYIYVVDRANTGLHILDLAGEARHIAGLH